MSRHKGSDGNPDDGVKFNSTNGDGLCKDSESLTEHKLFKDFDEKRRSFLKKLLISATYVTPAILSFSIGDSEARARKLPTRRNKKRRRQ